MRQITAFAVVLLASQISAADLPDPSANFPETDMAVIKLGQLLFYDPVLSGNKTVACATCHHPRFGTSDGVSLGLGDGGRGLGPDRIADPENLPEQRIGRNSPALFNLGASEFTSLFHDGRLERDTSRPSGIRSPLEDAMATGFTSLLSAQVMFPVLSPDEMAGHYSENEISQSVAVGFLSFEGGAWDQIAARVSDIDAYRTAFDAVIGNNTAIKFTDISNAIAAFIAFEWRADNAPFDQYLAGNNSLSAPAIRGLSLFYGKASCATCHSGLFQTDHNFHAIAMPQIGPGKAARFESHNRDIGRMRVTGNLTDAYKFRTPSLRNITATAPYGHAGAFARLEDVVRHHLDPVSSLRAYQQSAILPILTGAEDWNVLTDKTEVDAIAAANELAPISLSDAEVQALLAFLESLTDTASLSGNMGIPEQVPSGLPVDR